MVKWWFLVRIWILLLDLKTSQGSSSHGSVCASRPTPTQEGLQLDCSAKQLLHVPDDLPEQTTCLDLSLNNLSSLKAHAFVHIPWVLSINLTRSNIHHLHSKTFSGLDHLLEIYLPCNPVLTDPGLPNDIFDGLSNLHTLHIWTDKSAKMSFGAIDKIESLKHVTLTPNVDSIPSELQSLPNLKILTFAFGEIHNLTYDLLKPLSTLALEEIAFHACNIHHVDKEAFSNFTSLHLLNFACNIHLHLGNVIDSISTSDNVNVTELIVDLMGSEQGNVLGPEDTRKCRRAWLSLKRLSAKCISPLMISNVQVFFECLSGLKAISLSSTTILPLGEITREQVFNLVKDMSLVSLDLSHISAVPDPYVERVKGMCLKELANSIPSNQELLPHYTEPEPVCLQKQIKFEPAAHPECTSFKTNVLTIPPCLNYLTAQGMVANYVGAIRKCAAFTTNTLETLILSDIKGHPPGILKKPVYGLKNLKTLDYQNSDIRYISENYFSGCFSLRTLLLANNLLSLTNNSFLSSPHTGDGLRNLEVLDLAGNLFDHFDTNSFSNFPSLRNLYLSRNQLKEANFISNISKSVQFLDLAENKIVTLPKSITGKLNDLSEYNTITVNLSGNPWLCNCNNSHFIEWIQDTSVIILDIDTVKCLTDNGEININEVDIESFRASCQSRNLKIISGSTVASFLIGLVIAACLIYRLRWKIRWRYYKMRYMSHKQSDYLLDDMSTRSSFNAYVIFSMKDDVVRHWVAHVLCPRVEEEWNQGPLFLPGLRDDIGGAADVDNITEGLMSSQTAVWILSPAFFEDRHCEIAAHFAFHHLGAKRNLLIVWERRLSQYEYPRHFLNLLNKKNGIPRMTYSDETDDAERVFWTRLRDELSIFNQ